MLTPRMIKGIADAVQDTRIPLKYIAMISGITYQTLRIWLDNGEGYKQQIEEGKIKKEDLTKKQKRELELFEKVSVERTGKVQGYLDNIHKLAKKKGDIRAYQWLLKIEDPIFRDVDGEVVEANTIKNSNEVVVVNLGAGGVETTRLLSEFMDGSIKDGEEEEIPKEESEGSRK